MDREEEKRTSRAERSGEAARKRKKRRPESGEAPSRRKSSAGSRKRRHTKAGGASEHRGAGAKRSKKRQQKRTAFNIGSTVVLIAAVCVFVFSLYQLVMTLVPYYTGGQEYDQIRDLAITAEDNGEGFSVDFDALLEQNADTVAWIRFDEPSQINYPVVKSADNTDYLTKTFVANDNKLGAIFMDYRNNSDFSDRNTFIYGHHLNVGGEMFSELLQYEDESFCKEHPNFYIYTPDGKVRMYTIFSAGVVKDTADNYNITYESDEAFTEYLNICKESSNYQVDVELNAQSKIVSLSTCTNVRDDERFLVQGVLTEELGGE
ncbi:MAG TPA: class B sortase [Candidatus Mediterraneibacter faecigallinarum]|uniref:Class B sortase n=1 Tax=Candidatus Mediterraneibacter faecigallinarum TaxID=2838669 RepID=A0A9D2SX92_9FIRM|nr:class B sortase [Candidatus Mediterraneibacter faecigallinarum]